MLKLYCAPKTISTAVVAILNDAAIHWEPIRVDIAGGEQVGPEYLAINPKGRVPVLLTPQGPLTETGAILEYLAETVIHGYVPVDPLARAQMREVMYYLASTMHVNHAHLRRGYRWAESESALAEMAEKVPQTMTTSAEYIESLISGPFLFGSRSTLADFYLHTVCGWLAGDGVDTARFPKIQTFMASMAQTRGVKLATEQGFYQ